MSPRADSFYPVDVIQVSRSLPSLETFAQIHPQTMAVGCRQTPLSAPRPAEHGSSGPHNCLDIERNPSFGGKQEPVPVNFISNRNEGALKPFGLALYLGLLNFLSHCNCKLQSKAWLREAIPKL